MENEQDKRDEEKNDMEIENQENTNPEVADETKGTVIEIPNTKKYVVAGKVITMSSKREAETLAGEGLTRKELKDRVTSVVKKNGEEKEEKEGKEKKFHPKRIVAIAMIPIFMLTMAKACSQIKPEIKQETIGIHQVIYKNQIPQTILEGMVGLAGQEGMTANGIEGNAFVGNHYSWSEHAEAEKKASEGTIDFKSMQDEIHENLEKLTDENTSQQEKEDAAKRALELSKEVKDIFKNNEDFAKDYTERFKEASLAYKDSNTENEIITAEAVLENYMAEMGLSFQNVEALQEIVDAFEQGYELELEGEELADGDYIVTGKGVIEIAKKEGVDNYLWQKFRNLFRRDRDKGQEQVIDTDELSI